MATLYRKYRPQTFGEAVGQNHIKVTLQNEIGTGKIAHAYLFCGPRAVGKTTFARLLAKAVNCTNRKAGEFEPCNKCHSCADIMDNRSLDIIEMDAASHTGVDNVRENIIASARISPSSSKYKVYIIDEVHMLSTSSFNALLKTMEEPPAHAIFILCTTEIHKVPATIISRCERFDFKRINIEDIVKKLGRIAHEEGIAVEKDILEAIARHSEGHMRDAESQFGQLAAISGKEITRAEADLVIPRSDIAEIAKFIEILAKKDAASGIALINKIMDDGVDLEKFAGDLIEVLRKMLLGKINPALGERLGLDIGESFEIKINELKKFLDISQLAQYLEKFILAKEKMKNSFIMQLPLELALAEICFGALGNAPRISVPAPAAPASFRPNPSVSEPSIQAPRPAASAPAAPANFSDGVQAAVSHSDILARWSEFLAKIKKYNHSLSFVLRVCQPRSVNGNKVCLAFKYKFHKDRIDEAKMKEIVQNTLREVYAAPLSIEAIIDEAMEIDSGNGNGSGTETVAFAGGTETGNPEITAEEVPLPEEGPAADDAMSNLLRAFGGKIIG